MLLAMNVAVQVLGTAIVTVLWKPKQPGAWRGLCGCVVAPLAVRSYRYLGLSDGSVFGGRGAMIYEFLFSHLFLCFEALLFTAWESAEIM